MKTTNAPRASHSVNDNPIFLEIQNWSAVCKYITADMKGLSFTKYNISCYLRLTLNPGLLSPLGEHGTQQVQRAGARSQD